MPATSRGFRLLFCLLLLGASSAALARDIHLQGANGDGGGDCPAGSADTSVDPDIAHPAAKAAPSPSRKAKSAPSVRGNEPGNMRAPRWHSFLPGMFR